MLKILHLKTENIQRIKAVDITPGDNNLVVIGGNNGHGKTSVLDSIMFALGGKRSFSEQPVRNGSKEGSIEITIGDFLVKRRIKESGASELEISETGKGIIGSPQKFLEKFFSRLIDPLAFANMESKAQVEVLKSLISFNFSGNEKLRQDKYNERTGVNRDLKQKQAENEANPFDPTFPVDEEVFDFSDYKILVEAQGAKTQLLADVERGRNRLKQIDIDLKNAKEIIEKLEINKAEITLWMDNNEPKIAEFGNLEERMSIIERGRLGCEQKNARIRKNAEAKKILTLLKQTEAQANALTKEIEKLDAEKISAIASANLPVSGLSFSEDVGVLYQAIPFAQLSGAERLKVSLAMGIALNPALRVLLIRDGSLLDEDNLKVVAEMAKQHEMQVWIERVGKGQECSVIIEDGTVIENRIEGKNVETVA